MIVLYNDPYSDCKWSSIDCIVEPLKDFGGLYLGNIDGAMNIKGLKENNINAVLTVVSGTGIKYEKADIPNHKIIEAVDIGSYDLSLHFDSALEFISDNIKKGNVYVHCFAGISRSSTIVIAYLMKEEKWALAETLTYVKSKRSIISPNSGFLKQLENFEKKLEEQRKK